MAERKPKTCECGGRLVYSSFAGNVFSYCTKCTPVVTVRVKHRHIPRADAPKRRKVKGRRVK